MRTGARATTCAAGMLYLRANPLLREPLKPEHIKNRLLGHWGSDPGQTIFVGASEPADQEVRPQCDLYLRAWAWRAGDAVEQLSGRHYSEIYPDKSQDDAGMQKFFKQFSFPGGIGSHCTPETPGLDPRRRRAGLQPLAWIMARRSTIRI
jgi:xylulose-5-phosphate/fructose-6-phosphate phosphoketolase